MTAPRRVIPNAVPHLAGNEWKYVKECLDTNWVSSSGQFVDRFEREIAQYVGVPHAVATVNGTAAIHVALLAAGVTAGDEVLVPTFTFEATANAVAYCGAHPVFLGALFVLADPMFARNGVRMIELIQRANIPATFGRREFVVAGGLMSFTSSDAWHWRRSASFIDKILRGASPANLPVEEPTVFELSINLKTARALGLTIPKSLLMRADEVIE